MKKSLISILIFFCLILLYSSQLVLSENTTLSENLEINTNNIEEINEKLTNLTDNDINEKYITAELKRIILKNKVVNVFDQLFKEISFVFLIFLGIPYSFSFQFLIALIFFIILFIKLPIIIENSYKMPTGISYLLSLVILGLLGQIKFFKVISGGLSKMILSADNLMYLIIFVGVTITVMAIIYVIESYLARYMIEQKEKKNKESEELNREILDKTVKKIIKA